MSVERLQKVLAAAGLGSRRKCEELILQGRVFVDGVRVMELGSKADPEKQVVECDGERIRPARKLYYLVNKPKGVVCTNDDPQGRPRAVDLVPARDQRLFTVGRLDASTEGLLIITNDGDFTQRVAHPRHGITKTYEARVEGDFSNAAKQRLLEGVFVLGELCRAAWVKVHKRRHRETILHVTMQEGRNREVRRMLAKVGHRVLGLRRMRIGHIEDRALRPGAWRPLKAEEVRELLSASEPGGRSKRFRPKG